LHIRYLKTVEDLRLALLNFKEVYNAGRLVQKNKYDQRECPCGANTKSSSKFIFNHEKGCVMHAIILT
jgi:hypothetical protein